MRDWYFHELRQKVDVQTRSAGDAATDASPAVDTSAMQPAATDGEKSAPSTAPGRHVQNDRLDLDTTIVTGNRELPKVLYIVPWKKADIGDLIGRPANSLLDEVLTPVDREVFRRQTDYFTKLNAEAAPPAGPPPAEPGR